MTNNRMKRGKTMSFSPDFDENILYNILKRIEADTLYNLRVVCKKWHELIFDPAFANSNLTYLESGILTQIQREDGYSMSFMKMKKGKVKVQNLNMNFQVPIVASCNGLVVVKNFPEPGDLSVGNLLSRKGMKLPLHTCNLPVGDAFGFTYIQQTREYKIVRQVINRNTLAPTYKILALGSDEWRQVNWPQSASHPKKHVSIGSFVHSIVYNNSKSSLFSINTADESSHLMPLPAIQQLHSRWNHNCLMDLGGVLSFVAVTGSKAEVWVLEDMEDLSEKQWIKRHEIMLQVERFGRNDLLEWLEPIGSLQNGKLILFARGYPSIGSCCYLADLEIEQVRMLSHAQVNADHCMPHQRSLISCKS